MTLKEEKLISNSKNLNYLFFEKPNYFLKELEEPRSFQFFHSLMCHVYSVPSKEPELDVMRIKSMYDEYTQSFDDMLRNKKFNKKSIKAKDVFESFSNNNTSLQFYLDRGYSIEFAKSMLSERQSILTLSKFKKRYGEIEGTQKYKEVISRGQKTLADRPDYNDVCKSRGNSRRSDFYLDKINPLTNKLYTQEEAIEKIKKLQTKASKKRWEYYKDGLSNYVPNTTLEYYLRQGMSLTEAKIALIKRQNTASLESFIERYGSNVGIKKYEKRIQRYKKSFNNKSEEELKIIRIKQCRGLKYSSKSSTMFFENVLNALRNDGIDFNDAHYGTNEYFVYDNSKKRIFFYDFVIPSINYACEYNGHKFHPDPRLHEDEKHKWRALYSNKTYDECLEFDAYKNSLIMNNGFMLDVVWDFEDVESKTSKVLNHIKTIIQ